MFLPIFGLNREAKFTNYIKSLSTLVAYWPLNEISGSTSVNNAPATIGTLDGTVTGATINQPGASGLGKAYYFDGAGDRSLVTANAALQLQTFSIGAIVIPDNTVPAQCYIYGNIANGAGGFLLTNTNVLQIVKQGATIITTGNTALTNAVAYSVGVTYDGPSGAVNIYIGGVNDKSATNSQTLTYTGNHAIGAGFNGNAPMKGTMQHIWVTNTVVDISVFQNIKSITGI